MTSLPGWMRCLGPLRPSLASRCRCRIAGISLPACRTVAAATPPSRALRRYHSLRHLHAEDRSASSSPRPGPSPPTEASLDWEDNAGSDITTFADLPFRSFGVNQHMVINAEFKEVLRQVLWQFRAPIRYAFAYGSGVFPQTGTTASPSSSASMPSAAGATPPPLHPSAPEAVRRMQTSGAKMIDFIFGVSYSQHWHDINLQQHRAHYSALGSLGSYAVSRVQDGLGAGVYFNPYVSVNGLLIKYGVVNIDTLCADLSSWATLYLAGRLHKPVKILRDHPRVRLANQRNLLAALRVALLLLPERFSERQLFTTIAGISYLGDPRMNARLGGENPDKVRSIVAGQMAYFRRLYAPLIDTLPNLAYDDPRTASTRPEASWIHDPTLDARLAQDMDPVKRGNMVRRLPSAFREKLYFQYQSRLAIPRGEFNRMMEAAAIDQAQGGGHRRDGGEFEQRIAMDDGGVLRREVGDAIKRTVAWPSTSQSIKSFFTAGVGKSARYMREKRDKYRKAQAKQREATATKPKDE